MKRKILFGAIVVLIILIICLCVRVLLSEEEEPLPEIEYTIEECINKDNYNDWRVGLSVESPDLRS